MYILFGINSNRIVYFIGIFNTVIEADNKRTYLISRDNCDYADFNYFIKEVVIGELYDYNFTH